MTVKLIRMWAKDLAGAFYDDQQSPFRPEQKHRSEAFRRFAGTEKEFIQNHWTDFVDLARKTLAAMLQAPEGRVSEHMKNKIMEALLEDREQQFAREEADLAYKKHMNYTSLLQ